MVSSILIKTVGLKDGSTFGTFQCVSDNVSYKNTFFGEFLLTGLQATIDESKITLWSICLSGKGIKTVSGRLSVINLLILLFNVATGRSLTFVAGIFRNS